MRKRDVLAMFFAKAVALYLVVLIGLKLGLSWILEEMDAQDHVARLTFQNWVQVALVVTVLLLLFQALTSWALKPTDLEAR